MRVWFVSLFERLLNAQPYRDGKPCTSLSITRLLKRMIISLVVLMSVCDADVSPSTTVAHEEANLDFFPLGLYDVKTPDDLDAVKAGGFNMVHRYHHSESLYMAVAYLEAAETAGVKVRQNMPKDFLYAGDDFWIEWVTTLSSYDALAMWYLPEEPIVHGYDPATYARLYEIIQQYDPQQRPVATFFGAWHGHEDWCDVLDIIMVGCYPEYAGQPRACVKTRVDVAREACPSLAVVGVPQFFDSAVWGGEGYPTPHEARFDAYTNLIAGAKGLDWYSYYRGKQLPELWEGLQGIVQELNELGPVILSPDIPQTITVSVISGPTQSPMVQWRVYDSIQVLRKEGRGTHLLASNLATDTVVAEFSGLSPDTIAVEVLFEGRSIEVSEGSFRDSFAEADVHIYRAVTSITYLPYVIREMHEIP